jgi:hypothetical protein
MIMAALLDAGTIMIVPLVTSVKMCDSMSGEKPVSDVFNVCSEGCR